MRPENRRDGAQRRGVAGTQSDRDKDLPAAQNDAGLLLGEFRDSQRFGEVLNLAEGQLFGP